MSTKKIALIAIAVSILLILGAVSLVFTKTRKQSNSQPDNPYVEIAKVLEINWQPSVESSGNLKASANAMIKTEVAGRVIAVDFHSGETVNQGQLLVELENTQQQGELASSEAQLASDKATYQRYEKLLKTKAVSQAEYDTASYNYKISLGTRDQAQSRFDKTQIKAPFSGKIGLTNVSKGQYLSIGAEIANLVNLDNLYIDFEVPEKYSSRIKVGDKVLIESDAYPKLQFTGSIIALNTAVDSDTASLTVRATVPNEKHRLIPGSTVNVIVYYGKVEKTLVVPQTAVSYSSQGTYVYRYNNNLVSKTPVTTGAQQGQKIIITQGLSADDTVVSIGSNKVHNGQTVNVVASAQAKSQ